jgi:hypothetical protein
MRKPFLLIFSFLFPIVIVFNANAAIIGVDFGPISQPSPLNWNSISAEGTFNNLIDENGDTTGVGLLVVDNGGTALTWDAAINPLTIPSHTNPISNIYGDLYRFSGAAELELQFNGLEANTEYDVWVFGVRDTVSQEGMNQSVTITGQGTPVTFNQISGSQQLFVNDSLGSSSQNLYAYAERVTSTAGATLNINVVANGGDNLYAVPGVAIESVVQNQSIPTLSEWGMILMSLVLTGSAFWMIRRRQIA